MDIASITSRTISPPVGRNAAGANKTDFSAQAQSKRTSSSGRMEMRLSPYVQLRVDYQNWKDQQEPQVLPGSQGRTEENMNYLAQRYSGTLTMFQKMEALDTMSEMGILTTDQWNAFYGAKLVNFTVGIRSEPLTEGRSRMEQDEIELYRLSPLARSETLEDLFAWAEDLA